MKPLGRKYYKDKTGGKHSLRIDGKYHCWWGDVCTPSKALEVRNAKQEIMEESYHDDQDQFIHHIRHTIASEREVSIDKVSVVWSDIECEYCIYVNNKWCGYYDLDYEGD